MKHENTHTRRNSEEFGNVTCNLKEYRKSDPARLQPRARLDHSLDRSCARPLGDGQSVKQSADQAKKFKDEAYESLPSRRRPSVQSDHSKVTVKKEEFKKEAYIKKIKQTLQAEKKLKNEKRVVKVESRGKNERGFVLDDYIKGKIGFITIISTGDITGAFHIYFS